MAAYNTRSRTRAGGGLHIDPACYLDKRSRTRDEPPPPPGIVQLDDSSSLSGAESDEDGPDRRAPPKMTTTTPTPASSLAGKAPVLLGNSPKDLRTFTMYAKLFFQLKRITDDSEKIMWLGAGLGNLPELDSWFHSNQSAHLDKKYDDFLKELNKRALPPDFVWLTEKRIRDSKQNGQDYEMWSQQLRSDHLLLTDRMMSTRDFVKNLLYGMDEELASILRRGTSLKGTGFHEDDQSAAYLTSATQTPTANAEVDYEKFDREARDEWARIARRKESNAAQIKEATKRAKATGTATTTSSATGRSSSAPPSANTSEDRPRVNKLTSKEKDWLRANRGCFRCRKLRAGHEAAACTDWSKAPQKVEIPQGWKVGDPVPEIKESSATTSTTTRVTVAAIQAEEEIDLPESLAEGSDSDSDGYALPLLRLRLGSDRSGTVANALADSGSPVSLISDELVRELGLEAFRLKVPVACRGAFKENAPVHSISSAIRIRLGLENRSWVAGYTTLLVAPLESPLQIVLGNNFLHQHRISIVLYPEPRLLREQPDSPYPHDLYADVEGPLTRLEAMSEASEEERLDWFGQAVEHLVAGVQADTEEGKEMNERAKRIMREFRDVFPETLPPLSPEYLDRVRTRHRIKSIDPKKVQNQRGFNVPRKWREKWKKALDEHVESGRLRPSTSPYASAAFVIPKKDPGADPRWVNNYCVLNDNTVKDRTPLPKPDEILSEAAQARIWGKIDLTNAFFQTPVAEEDIEKTAIKTPWGLFEWTVMPQGLCNAPATHQARINEALRHLIGVCCQAFVDDVIIYSKTIDKHERNVRSVLQALREAGLYASPKKTDLFTLKADFLGHVISREGLAADSSKVDKIRQWPRPRTVAQVRGFLGLVQYLRKFIPQLAEHTAVLTPLTKKGVTNVPRLWGSKEEGAFEAIKKIVTSLPVLRPLDQDSSEPIWLMTDASKVGIGAVLLQGEDWRTARPCGFWSRQYISAERNYPTHEQELLGVVAAMKAWRLELLGVKFKVLTDHDTLRHFKTQQTLSKRQARWMETLADYDYELAYIPGKKNAVADAMSRFSFPDDPTLAVCGISTVALPRSFVQRVKDKYSTDAFCAQLGRNLDSAPGFEERDGLLYFEATRLVVPDDAEIREALLHDAHDALGHFGAKKTLAALSASFYWTGMAKQVEEYVASCDGCQRHKARTTRRAGRLHPLPVPPRPFADVALDFVGPLPASEGKDMLLTITDRLSGYTRLVACKAKDGAKEVAGLFFSEWVRFFGTPERLVSDRDKLVTSKFWKSLHKRLGTKSSCRQLFTLRRTDGANGRTKRSSKFCGNTSRDNRKTGSPTCRPSSSPSTSPRTNR